jgi:HAMP domain-containing protein
MTDEPDPLLMPSFRWFLLASLATIVVAALVAGRVSRSLTGPIRASRDVARRIAAGDLDARIPDGQPPAETRSASWSPRSTRWPTTSNDRTHLNASSSCP